MKRYRIGVIYSRVRVEEKWIFAALETRGVDYERLDDRLIHFDPQDPTPWQRFDAVLSRSISATRGLYALRTLEALGVPTVNAFRVAEICSDKMATTLALAQAGLPRAQGLFAALGDDGRNMLLTVVARYVNPQIKIVSECRDNKLTNKFYRAGATYVVNPMFIGGMRMASEMLRPRVVTFLDRMLRGQKAARVEQAVIGENSALAGKTLAQADIPARTGLTPIALEMPDGRSVFNPGGEEVLESGAAIIVIGEPEQVARLRAYCEKG